MESSASTGAGDVPKGMQVCVVTETFSPEVNGVAMTLGHLIMGLLKRKHLVTLIRPRQHAYDRPGCCTKPNVVLVPGLPVPGYKTIRFGLPMRRKLQKIWNINRPDVIYVATQGPLGWAAVVEATRGNIPVISGFHTNFHRYAQHYHVAWVQQILLKYLRYFHNHTLQTLVPTRDLQNELISNGFDNVGILSRGVDSRLYSPEKRIEKIRKNWGVADDSLTVLFVGRLAPEKNLALAVDCYRAMQRHYNKLKFIIVGDGPLYESMQREHPDIIFCGIHRGEHLAQYYASADIFLFPSETETFGNVILEAMASGLAVVAFNYAAAGMHIAAGETGMIVPLGDRQAFIDAAISLIKDPDHLNLLRHNARTYAEQVDWDDTVNLFEEKLFNAAFRN